MSTLRIKPYLIRLYLGAFALFLLNKFGLRPFLRTHDGPEFANVLAGSLPNLCESVIGMSATAGLLFLLQHRLRPRLDALSPRALYLITTIFCGVYVLTQEVGLHALGGNNVYDPYDVAASLLGLCGMLVLFIRHGVVEEPKR